MKVTTLAEFPTPSFPCIADADWVCGPVGQTRDSDPLESANFEAACRKLLEIDPGEDDWEAVEFGHFAVGWVQEIFTRPGSAAREAAITMKAKLVVDACLDEALWSEYSQDAESMKESDRAANS